MSFRLERYAEIVGGVPSWGWLLIPVVGVIMYMRGHMDGAREADESYTVNGQVRKGKFGKKRKKPGVKTNETEDA